MFRSTVRLGHIAGIEIGVHWSWLFIFFLMAWSLATAVFDQTDLGPGARWIAGVITSAIFFASVLLHELAHSLLARRNGIPVRNITLFVFGGVSNLEQEASTPKQEFWIAIIGPLTSLALAVLFAALWLTIGRLSPVLGEPLSWLAIINVALFLFNMLPGFPLDGGRVFRAILWWNNRSHLRATQLATRAGTWVAWLLIAGGLAMLFIGGFVSGLWLMLIGWFLRNAAESSYAQTVMDDAIGGMLVRDAMTTDYETVPPDLDLRTLVSDHVLRYHHRAFPVVVAGHLQGLITLANVRAVPQDAWPTTSVYKTMIPRDAIHSVDPATPVQEALRLMAQHDVNQLPVIDSYGELLGLITRADMVRLIQIRSELASRKASAHQKEATP